VSTEFKKIYVTRYMGSKLRLLDFIVPTILENRERPFTFVDLMAGTHAVGYALRSSARIVSNDTQYYAKVFGRALIENRVLSKVPSKTIDDLVETTSNLVAEGWFTKTYKDTYFSRSQCREIETLRLAISTYPEEPLHSMLLTSLAYAMGYSQSSPGHFAQYMPPDHARVQALRKLSVRAAFFEYLRLLNVNTTGASNEVHQSDVHEFLASPPASLGNEQVVAYLDPPYSPAQYSRYYHLIETVLLNDEPEVAFKGLYRPDRFSSNFCSERHVLTEFQRVLEQVSNRGWDLAISYGTHALLPSDELLGLTKLHFRNVTKTEQVHPHSMQGRGVVQGRGELLFMCRH